MAVAQPELPADVVNALRSDGEDPDAALARLFQEQEHAWFVACGGGAADLHHGDAAQSLPSELQSAGSTDSTSDADEHRGAAGGQGAGADDVAFALNVQREEYREHLRGMLDMLNRVAGQQQYADAAADVEHMSYEELQALGDTIGKVKVGISGTQLNALRRGTFAQLRGCAPAQHDTCAVCQEQVGGEEQLTQLPCEHVFHHGCIAQWFDGSKACPVCMTEVPADAARGADAAPSDAGT